MLGRKENIGQTFKVKLDDTYYLIELSSGGQTLYFRYDNPNYWVEDINEGEKFLSRTVAITEMKKIIIQEIQDLSYKHGDIYQVVEKIVKYK